MKNKITENKCNIIERNGQLVISLNTEILLPKNAPVRLASAQLEELEYRKLYEAYSPKGRKSAADPRVMFKVMAYGYECGIYSSRKLEEACRYRIDFMWLLEDEPVPDHTTFARFRTGRCAEAVEDLFYQYVRLLEKQGETDHKAVFIDGTKLESRAGRYTFCWRKSVEKQREKVKAEVYCLTGLKKLGGLQRRLAREAKGIVFVHGNGKRKSDAQREWEALDGLRQRWEQYEESLAIMGGSRNSYSKTDHDATFMRMKEDHMRNGQLKPAYNVQIGVNSEYITGIDVFSNRTDYGTLQPFLKTMERKQHRKYEKIVADAGYESVGNYLYLEKHGLESYIKPQNHEVKQTAKFKRQIGRAENMRYNGEGDYYVCAQGRKLKLYRESEKDGIVTSHYRCESCVGCPCRAQCCKAKDGLAKELQVRKQFERYRAISEANVTTDEGICLRLCRSIQAEGTFALLKTDFGFRRFLTTGKANVRTEFFFLALGFNLKKRWMKQENGRLQSHMSVCKTA